MGPLETSIDINVALRGKQNNDICYYYPTVRDVDVLMQVDAVDEVDIKTLAEKTAEVDASIAANTTAAANLDTRVSSIEDNHIQNTQTDLKSILITDDDLAITPNDANKTMHIAHTNAITAGSIEGSSGQINPGGSVAIPKISYDSKGHITEVSSTSISLPTVSYDLPEASGTVLGGIKLGDDMTSENGVLQINHASSTGFGLTKTTDSIASPTGTAVPTEKAVYSAIETTKSYADSAASNVYDTIMGGATQESLDTIKEIADLIGDSESLAGTLIESIAGKAPLNHTHQYAGSSSVGGAANEVITAEDSTNEFFLVGATSASPNAMKRSSGVSVQGSNVKATNFIGHLTGNADSATTANACTGNAATATKLNAAAKINGVDFDGSTGITVLANPETTVLTDSDLNTIKTPGFYYAAGSNSCTNKPSGVNAFALLVYKSSSGYVTQEVTAASSNAKYIRVYTGSSWGDWSSFYTSANPQANISGSADSATKDSAGNTITSTYVSTLSASGRTVTYTKGDGSTGTFTTQDTVYTHPGYTAKASGLYKVTVDASGHVSATDAVTKADITALGIPGTDTNTVYTHPAYTSRAAGLYKVTVDATGHVSAASAVTKADITALGIPGTDTNTTYSAMGGATSDAAGAQGLVPAPAAGSATRYLRSDGTWAVPPDTNTIYTHPGYTARSAGLYKVTVDATGHVSAVASVTKADITALGIPGTDTNTTYSSMGGATASANGAAGLVPAPASGAATRYLRSDGTWSVPPDTNTVYTHPAYTARSAGLYKVTVDATGHVSAVASVTKADITALGIPGSDTNTTYSAMRGATTSAAGAQGLVPAPAAGAATRYLRSDGAWVVPPDTNTNTTYSAGSGLSLSGTTFKHAASVTAATTSGTSGNLSNGATFTVPYVTFNATGHITAHGTRSIKLPSLANPDIIQASTPSNPSGAPVTWFKVLRTE